ncbi:DUF4349 domain-containing protein [Conexibacter woesei]|uniref:Protein kinase n=1 Tax=Conexibacter woesei (strain DSM 14684 / CCUG 47730 / CIP 108061 / JCM 11494 / NBRC 100937 / ID131577) TaxID=469383 RepID=D3F2S7_CONWI|nr:DUF4349 domain-containing protein [Conexibacter woesei]ADB54208.1 protein kinase [Conexibacter woesei DSM 14684]
MRRRERTDPAAARELAAIDAALAGGPVGEEDAELARLATLLVAERPPAPPAFRAALDARVAERFPAPAPARAAPAVAGGRWRRLLQRPLLPAVGGTLAVALVALAIVLGQGGGGTVGGGAGTPAGSGASSGAAADGAAPGSAAQGGAAADEAAPGGARAGATAGDAPAAKAAPESAGTAPADSDGAAAPASPAAPGAQRKVEQSSAIELGAPAGKVDDVAQDVLGVVARQQGIVDQSSVATGGAGGEARFELRIPAARLQAALAQLSGLADAQVLARTDDTLDVNQAYVSVRRRLAGAEAERGALLRSLRAADTETETNRLRARLDGVERAIAGLQRSQRALDRRVDYSRVALTVRAVEGGGEDDGAAFTPGSALDDAGRVLAVTAGVAVIALAALVPLALLAACAWPLARAVRRRRREQALDAT